MFFTNGTMSEGDIDGSTRDLFTSDGNTITTTSTRNPYGFWTIHYKEGKVPEVLSGFFTSFAKAKLAVENYLNNSKFGVTLVPEPVVKPVLQTKQEKKTKVV